MKCFNFFMWPMIEEKVRNFTTNAISKWFCSLNLFNRKNSNNSIITLIKNLIFLSSVVNKSKKKDTIKNNYKYQSIISFTDWKIVKMSFNFNEYNPLLNYFLVCFTFSKINYLQSPRNGGILCFALGAFNPPPLSFVFFYFGDVSCFYVYIRFG